MNKKPQKPGSSTTDPRLKDKTPRFTRQTKKEAQNRDKAEVSARERRELR